MKKVTKEEYFDFFKKNKDLKPISSFSDMDGTLPFGYGVPAMDTNWGLEETDEPLARCEMRKENRHCKDWQCEFFLNTTYIS